MDSLADVWVRSGKSLRCLYQGITQDIVDELKAWVERRKANNDAAMEVSWNMFHVMDASQQLSNQPVEEEQVPMINNQIFAMVATQIGHLDRNRKDEEKNARETLLANFLLSSLRFRGIRWPQMPRTERTQADAGVCAFLGTVDQDFNAAMELEVLEDNTRITQWQAELRRRDARRAQEIANDPIPGVNTHPIGLVGARFRQVVANNPTISTKQALNDAADGVMIPGSLDFVMGSNSTGNTGTPSATREATRAAGENAPTTDNTAVYIANMLGNVNLATGLSSSTATATPSISNVAPEPSSNAPADVPDNTNIATGPSSSTFLEAGVDDQTLDGTKGQDEGSKMSKAKKKREGRKRAKAARAKEAAENAGSSISNDDDDDDDGEAPDVVDV